MLQAEVRSLSREELLGTAGLPIEIPTDQALAMKADLSLPWNKLRVVRRVHTNTFHTTYTQKQSNTYVYNM